MSSDALFRLIVREGPTPGEEREFQQPELIVGRDEALDFSIGSPGVSFHHARIFLLGGTYHIEDLNSTNGTFVNGQHIAEPTPLQPGDLISLGQSVRLVFEAMPQDVGDVGPADTGPAHTMLEQAPPEFDVGATQPSAHAATEAKEPLKPAEPETPAAPPERLAAPPERPAAPPERPAVPPPMPPSAPPAAPTGPAETMLGGMEEPMFDAGGTPPQFVVEVAGETTDSYTLTSDMVTIGRMADNDIVVPSRIVSRYHARLERSNGGYLLVPLPDAANPVLLEGRPLHGPHRLRHEDKLRIGGLDPGLMVTMTYRSPDEATASVEAHTLDFGDKSVLVLGRDPSSDLVLDAPQVSRYHAQLERVGQRYRIRDLRSSNGTFVNDQRIDGEQWLNPEDAIRVGPYRFVMGRDRLAQVDESGGLRVDAMGLNKWVRKDLNILQDISVSFQPREFIVVVGQSGGGKSTLVDAIAGYRPATHGRVVVNGTDVYKNFDAIRNDIGFVPQRDIIHMELTVFQALDYAARLRMPPDTTREERYQRIDEVLEDLDLAHRRDVQISGLSGGQQKRVSIGVELLTKPRLFFLDEPTSGLDPGTETSLMQLMRRLSDQGRTIVLVTHATKNVMLADKVIFLARGGYLAWFGPPDEALKYFDQFRTEREQRTRSIEFDEIYAILDDPGRGNAAQWAERYRQHPAYHQYVVQPLQEPSQPPGAPSPDGKKAQKAARPARKRQISPLRQFLILSARNIRILARDRFSLMLMLAAAPLISLIDFLLAALLGKAPFDFFDGNVFSSMIMLFLMPVYGVMIGALATMREIVKEQDIYRRERLVNLRIGPYVMSKVWVAILLALYHAVAYTVIRYVAFDMPGDMLDFGFVYVSMALATFAGMMLGLFASALAPNSNSAPLLAILFVLPQIVLGGALVPLPEVISAPTSTRWGYEALMAITGVGSDVAKDVCWALPPSSRNALTLEEKEALGCNCMGLAMLNENSCNFPGLGQFYNETAEAPRPVEPPPLRPEPPEPTIPDRPEQPEDQSDNVAMAEYFDALQVWEDEVSQIQNRYRADIDLWRAEAEVFQAEMVAHQTELAAWQVARASAVQPAETLVNQIRRDMGWTFVDKDDYLAYYAKLIRSWIAQSFISVLLLVGILILQKRKDIV